MNTVLVGEIACGLVMVSGQRGLELDPGQRARVAAQHSKACAWLESLEPRARLRFRTEHQHVVVGATGGDEDAPGRRGREAPAAPEDVWVVPALRALGHDGHDDYLEALRASTGCTQAFAIYVGKFRMAHFAYARDDRICLSWFCGGLGVQNMHALLVHETCHLFGAADEADGCRCPEKSGHLQVENGNCTHCNAHPQPCIMAGNSLDLCPWTRRQIGWDDAVFDACSAATKPGI